MPKSRQKKEIIIMYFTSKYVVFRKMTQKLEVRSGKRWNVKREVSRLIFPLSYTSEL